MMRKPKRMIVVPLLCVVMVCVFSGGYFSYSQQNKKSMSQKIKEAVQKRDSVIAEQKFQAILDSIALYNKKEDTALAVRENVIIKEQLKNKEQIDKANEKAYKLLVAVYMQPKRDKVIYLNVPKQPSVQMPANSILILPSAKTPEPRNFWDHLFFRNN